MTVTVCGHSKIVFSDVAMIEYKKVLTELIEEGADEFLLGGYGNFDNISASILYELKETYPHIRLVLVTAYIDRGKDSDIYDDVEYPPIENVPLKFAILERNKWMVDNSDVVIAHIIIPAGGAAKTLEYAERKKKRIIHLEDKSELLSRKRAYINKKFEKN